MSRQRREAQIETLYGGPEALVVVTEKGGRKRDTRKILTEKMAKMMGSYQQGSVEPPRDVLSVLGDLPYQLRYGMGAQEKDDTTALGGAPGYEDPQAPGRDWTGARRSMSGFLGGKRFGETVPNLAQDTRNAVKFYKALMFGEQPIGYSEPGGEAPGIDLRLHDVQRKATRIGAQSP